MAQGKENKQQETNKREPNFQRINFSYVPKNTQMKPDDLAISWKEKKRREEDSGNKGND